MNAPLLTEPPSKKLLEHIKQQLKTWSQATQSTMKQKIAELDDQHTDEKTYEAGCEFLLKWYKEKEEQARAKGLLVEIINYPF